MEIWRFIIGMMLILWAVVAVAVPQKHLYNPKPAPDDWILPMPGDAIMVFRPVHVPGKGFWGDLNRLVQLGYGSGGPFEGVQKVQVSGSFPDEKKEAWIFYIGKYEVTIGQFVAVMGMDYLLQVSQDPNIRKLPQLQGKARQKLLASPISFLAYEHYQAFIRRYNQWLFDPEHPERLQALPKRNGIPGFLRLPTEVEWEYAARGGEVGRRQGVFDDPLPFPRRTINKHAWHLRNAKHKLRPIGLRKPNPLGIHDMLGNVQEILDSRFLPEMVQGQPGGMSVRGGSVSTPPAELRVSLRSELDVWSWNEDKKQMQPRASFNTGIRLAIGANVIGSAREKAKLIASWEAYKNSLRRKTPVGQSLLNPVAQGQISLDNMNPIMQRLSKNHPDIQADLAAIQQYLDKAREQLDQAQRLNARSLAQDAARNGVNYSIYLAQRQRLEAALESARELANLSTRYQRQVEQVEKRLHELRITADKQFSAYMEKLMRLGEYPQPYLNEAFSHLRQQSMSKREATVIALLEQQIQGYRQNLSKEEARWRQQFIDTFAQFKD